MSKTASKSTKQQGFDNSKQAAVDKKKTPKIHAAKSRRLSVDIVTGQKVVSVYFDPSKCVDYKERNDEWLGEHFYSPARVVKEENGIVQVCLGTDEMFKMNEVTRVTDNDDEGVDDILKLKDFSEMSLVHTLRVRYYRDEIYTFVGPILVSLNPYKLIKEIYSNSTMAEYHGSRLVLVHFHNMSYYLHSDLKFSLF